MLICKSVNNLFNQYSRFLHLATATHFLLATKTLLKTALTGKAGLSVPKFTTKWLPIAQKFHEARKGSLKKRPNTVQNQNVSYS